MSVDKAVCFISILSRNSHSLWVCQSVQQLPKICCYAARITQRSCLTVRCQQL